jgi:hypothetical protein
MKFKFSAEDLTKYIADKRLKEGFHAAVVVDVNEYVNADGDSSLKVAYKALKDPDDPTSLVGRPFVEFVNFPGDNAKYPEMIAKKLCDFLNCLFPDDCPAYPRWSKELGSLVFQGEPISKDEEVLCRQKAFAAALEKSNEQWGDGSEPFTGIVGSQLFLKIYYNPESKMPDQPRIAYRCVELPDDAELHDEPEELVGVDGVGVSDDSPKKKKRKK